LRPLHDPAVEFRLPYDVDPAALGGWSSFPSDHAALFFAVATGLFFVSARAGLFAWLYVLVVICLPRVYLGFHYPSDILAGALLGAAWVIAANRLSVARRVTRPLLDWSKAHPSLFHAGLFALSFQIVTLFDDVREMSAFAWLVLKARLLGTH
jgi:undecaprenyl-diphosphatase